MLRFLNGKYLLLVCDIGKCGAKSLVAYDFALVHMRQLVELAISDL